MTDWLPCPWPGVYPGVPFNTFLRWDAIDASTLKAAAHTLNYAREKREAPDDEKRHYCKGRYFHALALEPETVDDFFVVRPKDYHHPDDPPEIRRPWNGNAKVCKEWREEHCQLTIMEPDVAAEAIAMAARVRSHPHIGPMVKDCQTELSVVWDDAETGVRMKRRYDGFKNGIVIDPKSTSKSASHRAFISEADRHRYHIEAAVSIDSMKVLNLVPKGQVPWFAFVVVEGYAPYELQCFDVQDDKDALSFDYLCYGRFVYRNLLRQVALALKTGEWPGYSLESLDMELTYAARQQFEQDTSMR